jgi:hypothetical protein
VAEGLRGLDARRGRARGRASPDAVPRAEGRGGGGQTRSDAGSGRGRGVHDPRRGAAGRPRCSGGIAAGVARCPLAGCPGRARSLSRRRCRSAAPLPTTLRPSSFRRRPSSRWRRKRRHRHRRSRRAPHPRPRRPPRRRRSPTARATSRRATSSGCAASPAGPATF